LKARGSKQKVGNKQHNDELHCVNFLSNIIWVITSGRIRRGRAAAWMGEKANSYRNLKGKSEENGQRARPIRTREENTEINLKQRMG
jgi:hypothetical protein